MKILGIDIGMTSVGFSLVDFDSSSILAIGSHIFEAAEQPKTGSSLAEPRRNARSARRIIRRRAKRMLTVTSLFNNYNIKLPSGHHNLNPWQLRAEALERCLSSDEFAIALYHIAKHRGFKSTKKGESKSEDVGKLKAAASEVKIALDSSGYKTPGAYFYYEKLCKGLKVRNGANEYNNTILRDLNKEEVKLIFEHQRNYGLDIASPKLEQQYTNIAFFQRSLKSVEDMVGYCDLEPEERRAPKASRSAELFILWQSINNLRIQDGNGQQKSLDNSQKKLVYQKAHQLKKLDYKQLRKLLSMNEEQTFKGLLYRIPRGKTVTSNDELYKMVESKKFIELSASHTLKDILGDFPSTNDEIKKWDEIARVLSFQSDLRRIDIELRNPVLNLDESEIRELKEIDFFKGTVGHSIKAINKLLPYLEEGETYDKAKIMAGYALRRDYIKTNKIPAFIDEHRRPLTNNPVVTRALAQARKVINAVIREYGMPDKVHIELARDLSQPFGERRKRHQESEARRVINESIKADAEKELGFSISPLKYRLWKEQNYKCLYSGEPIREEHLRDPLATEIDHALPYSRSYDNSQNNLVLVFHSENQRKGNRTVWEYFSQDKSTASYCWDDLVASITHLPKPKRDRILNQNFAQQEGEWKERHLNDTRYIARLLKQHIEHHLDLPGDSNKQKVLALSGGVTAYLRRQWGLQSHKNREDSCKHHALDAVVIACCTPGLIQKVANYNKIEARKRGLEPHAPKPWSTFRDDVINALDSVFVSRMPCRKVSGEIAGPNPSRLAIHPETGEEQIVERVKVSNLDLKKLERLIDKETHNAQLYKILKKRLESNEISQPLHLESGQIVHKVSIWGDAASGRKIRGGLVSNGDQICIDVFRYEGKYYLQTLFAYDFLVGHLPNPKFTPRNGEPIAIGDEHFVFRVYRNDYVVTVNKNGERVEGYYRGNDINDKAGRIRLIKHDEVNLNHHTRVSTQNLKSFEIYSVKYIPYCEQYSSASGYKESMLEPIRYKKRPSMHRNRNDLANNTCTEPRKAESSPKTNQL